MKFITTKIPYWDTLNAIRETKFIRSMSVWIFVVPVVAKVFQKVEEAVRLDVFGQEFELCLSLPFSWHVFFWCAVSFGFSNLIVILWAPKIIKENKDFSSFRVAGKNENHLAVYANEVGSQIKPFEFSRTHSPEEEGHYQDYLRGQFWQLYDHANMGRFFARCFCGFGYLVGVLLLGYLLLSNICWVIRFALS